MTISLITKNAAVGVPASMPGDPLFFDDFDYELERVQASTTKRSVIQAAGWNSMKDSNFSQGAMGYIYTVDSIEGYEGVIPGSSGRALCIEAFPISGGQGQSDMYLQYGQEPGILGTLPADVWFQFWIYVQRDSDSGKISSTPTGKFLYALHGSRVSYPESPFDTAWLFGAQANAYDPDTGRPTVTPPENGAWTFMVEANPVHDPALAATREQSRAYIPAQDSAGEAHWRMTPMADPSFTHFLPNRWYLIKTHMDVSENGGKWELWAREKGTITFTKMADFRDSVSPDENFSYKTFQDFEHFDDAAQLDTDEDGIPEDNPNQIGFTKDHRGPRILRMPTTAGSDYWAYLADFAIAESEEDLPVYGSY